MRHDEQQKSGETSNGEPQDQIRDLEQRSIPDRDAQSVQGGTIIRITNMRGNATPPPPGTSY